MEFLLFFCIFPDFLKKKYRNSEKITPSFNRFHSQILLNDFGFWDFSIDPRHVGSYGKIPNPSKSSPGGLWKRQSFGVIFSEFWYFFFKKSGKIQKNCKNSKKIKNEAGVMYCLIYIFFRFYYWRFDFQKNIFLNFSHF